MSEQLNIELARSLIEEKGWKFGWVFKQIGLSQTTGTLLLSRGVLPSGTSRRKDVLYKLATLLGVDERQLVLRLEAKRA